MSTPLPAKVDLEKVINVIRARLIRAVFAISEASETSTRSTIDSFGKNINPTAAKHGASMFGFNPRPHPRNPSRTTHLSKIPVMLAMIGLAVLAYYDAVLNPTPANMAVMEDKTDLVEKIAAFGLAEFNIVGSESFGYTLKHKDAE